MAESLLEAQEEEEEASVRIIRAKRLCVRCAPPLPPRAVRMTQFLTRPPRH